MAKTQTYSMPRGDSRSLPIGLPISAWSAGSHLYFKLKPIDVVDNADLTDSAALLTKTLSDTDIQSTDSVNKNYVLKLLPTDTRSIAPGIYRAEFEYVSSDGLTVLTFPDPAVSTWLFTITGDVVQAVS